MDGAKQLQEDNASDDTLKNLAKIIDDWKKMSKEKRIEKWFAETYQLMVTCRLIT